MRARSAAKPDWRGASSRLPGRVKPVVTRSLAAVALGIALVASVAGCAGPAMIAVGAGHAMLIATDRRTTGAQLDDETIELKIITRVNELYGERVNVNVTSYNGMVLLTGEVPDQGAWASIGNVAKNTEKVRIVQNELVVAGISDLSARANDSYITSKVKGRFIEADKFPPNAVKVVTERRVAYLMGIVSRAEGTSAGEIAATTDGVVRVVKVFEYRG